MSPTLQNNIGDTDIGLGTIFLIVTLVSIFILILMWSIRKIGRQEETDRSKPATYDQLNKIHSDLGSLAASIKSLHNQFEIILKQQSSIKNTIELTRVIISMKGRHNED